jgi:DNA-binding MarR family transcriptional regulator
MDRVHDIQAQWRRERPDLDVGPMGLIGRINRLAQHLTREMEATLAGHGLNFSSFDVLATLRRSGQPYALSPGDLMETMMITSGTMTNRIDQLERAGLVTRQPNPNDARSVLIALTERGFEVVEAAVADHVATQGRLVAALPPEAREALDGILGQFLETVEGQALLRDRRKR